MWGGEAKRTTTLNVKTGQVKNNSDTATCRECYSVSKNGRRLTCGETWSEFIALVWEVRVINLRELRLFHGTTVFLKQKISCFHTVFRKWYVHWLDRLVWDLQHFCAEEMTTPYWWAAACKLYTQACCTQQSVPSLMACYVRAREWNWEISKLNN